MTAQTILPANSVVATGYDVANSCRFDDGSSAYMHRTPSAGNRRTMTLSVWIKGSSLADGSNNVLGQYNSSNENNAMLLVIEGAGKIMVWNYTTDAYTMDIRTNRLLRDNSAWYHIVVAVDTTQATAANRVKVYVNGVQETSLAVASYPAENLELFLNQGVAQNIGTQRYGSTVGSPFDGYMAEFCFIEGTQNAPTDFGEFDEDSGIWKPIDVSDLTFGTNGYYLDFQDGSALGNDVSGNNNDFTTVNLAAIDQTTDTCTNNFATLNPSYHLNGGAVFSEGNLKFTTSGNSSNARGVSTIRPENGKWYVECKVIDKTRFQIGLMNNNEIPAAQGGDDTNSVLLGYGGDFYYNGTGFSDYIADLNNNDIVQLALDLDNNLFWFGVNNTWGNSATRTEIENATATNSGSTDISSITPISIGAIGIFLEDNSGTGNHVSEINFGNPSFTGTDQADGNGFGSFEYAPPSGYLALCTKNLATNG